jgi:hypothetical protein
MKMAKASNDDLVMAIDLANMLETLGSRLCPFMPSDIAQNDGEEHFDRDDDEQCGRALRALLEIADRASLHRVVIGASVMLDPRNELVDPDADTIEHHPKRKDSDRLTWLVKDHESPYAKALCIEILWRIQGLGYEPAVDLIDKAMAATVSAG